MDESAPPVTVPDRSPASVAVHDQVGVTAMLVASKYEEIWAPEVKDFVYISDEAYSRQQILDMEKIMLNTLKFNLTVPTPHNFLARFLKAAGTDQDTEVRAPRPRSLHTFMYWGCLRCTSMGWVSWQVAHACCMHVQS